MVNNKMLLVQQLGFNEIISTEILSLTENNLYKLKVLMTIFLCEFEELDPSKFNPTVKFNKLGIEDSFNDLIEYFDELVSNNDLDMYSDKLYTTILEIE